MTPEFTPWPKISRLNRDIVITEKIDGTNAAIHIMEDGEVWAQSRSRLIQTEDDNFGFARWVEDNSIPLTAILGTGTHFGEWWGSGIQRGYGLTKGDKRFSLFRAAVYTPKITEAASQGIAVPGLDVVPILYEGPFSQDQIELHLKRLAFEGSLAAPGFAKPEGIVIWHDAARVMFKVTIEKDEAPKGRING